ncbi:MAG: hypothetical protein J6S25_00670, partial [Aeriscardovia sp.]|nr:hypothetical protein [Aeriscardovia sp.]
MSSKESGNRDRDLQSLQLASHLFGDKQIRTVWDKDNERYLISVVDIVGALTESKNPRDYWKVLKHRLREEGNESVTNCNRLKLKARDG